MLAHENPENRLAELPAIEIQVLHRVWPENLAPPNGFGGNVMVLKGF